MAARCGAKNGVRVRFANSHHYTTAKREMQPSFITNFGPGFWRFGTMYAPGPGEGSDEPKPAARRRATRPASRHRETLRRPQTATSPLRGPPSAKLLRFPDGRTRLPMAAARFRRVRAAVTRQQTRPVSGALQAPDTGRSGEFREDFPSFSTPD